MSCLNILKKKQNNFSSRISMSVLTQTQSASLERDHLKLISTNSVDLSLIDACSHVFLFSRCPYSLSCFPLLFLSISFCMFCCLLFLLLYLFLFTPQNAETNLSTLELDLSYLKDQITISEVNIARLHNYKVTLKQAEKPAIKA